MGNLFGIRRRAPLVSSQDKAILRLKLQRDTIVGYQKRIERDMIKNKDLALLLFEKGLKDRAVVVLKRKKQMEQTLSRTDQQLMTLEQLVNDIEYTQIEVSVVEGLKVGTEALKELNTLMNIDDIQQMLEDNEEAAEKQREISDILQRSTVRVDEDELLKELEALRPKEFVEDKEASTNKEIDDAIKDLPEVPTNLPKETILEEEPIQPGKKDTRQLELAQ